MPQLEKKTMIEKLLYLYKCISKEKVDPIWRLKKKKRIVGGLWNKSGLCGFGFVWATDVTLCPK